MSDSTSSTSTTAPPRGRWLRALVLLAALLTGATFGWREVEDRIAYVTETDARIAGDLITLSSRVAGWVTDVSVREGDRVEAGAVLATIDDRESRLRLEQLEARLRATQSERERLAAERDLIDHQTHSRYETQLSRTRAADASVSALEAQVELARSELERSKSLVDRKVIPVQQHDQARANARRLEGEYRMAVAEREEASAQLEEARVERARLVVLDREVDTLAHRRAELASQVEQQRLDLADRVIRSPVGGVVDRKFVEAGEYVTPGQRLIVVHDPALVWVEANVKETEISRLDAGQPVEIRVDAFAGERFSGTIESIGHATTASFALLPSPNPSGNFTKVTQRLPVRIAVDQSAGRLRPGMMVEVKIRVGE